jgi:hypothetical protein
MPTLNIEGKRVKVDDSFLQLSPEEQASTVDEIAASIGIKPGGMSAPESSAYAPTDAMSEGLGRLSKLTQDAAGGPNQDDMVRANMEASQVERATGNSPVQDAVIDPLMGWGDEAYNATIGAASRMAKDGVGYGEAYKRESMRSNELERRRRERSPIASTAGDVAGVLVPAGAISKAGGSLVARAAGSGLPTRALAGAAEGALYGGVTGGGMADYGEKASGATSGAAIGAAAGGALPVAGAAIRRAGGKVMSAIRSAANPKAEAAARVKEALAKDNARGLVMSADDVASANANGQPIINADRGGQNVRSLARSAANQSPDVWGQMDDLTKQRFYGQSDRAVQKVSKIVGGNVDDLAAQDQLRTAARKANGAAYEKAYGFNLGTRQPMQLDAIQQRVPAQAMREAMQIAKAEGRPFGEQLVASIDDAADQVVFRRTPSMREWDYIQRGLRGVADKAYRSGSGGVGTAYKDLRQELLGVLDEVNPDFKAARLGASAAFGAEDALEAGKKFASTRRNTGEMARAIKDMKPAEKKLFETGFASELVDRLKSPSDSVDVIKQVFGSPEAREKMVMAFGKNKARKLEAFARVESAMHMTRSSLGNSTTARQLAEMGLVGGANLGGTAYGLATGDWRYQALIAAGTAARYGKGKVDQRVIEKIGDLLLSGDPKAMDRIIQNTQASSAYMDALRAVTDSLAKYAPAAGAVTAVSSSQ